MSPQETPQATQASRVLAEAAHWYAVFCSGEASEDDHRHWRYWHDMDPRHQQAWQQVERLQSQIKELPARLAKETLDIAERESLRRRTVLKSLMLFAGSASFALSGWRAGSWGEWVADYRTSVGERRQLVLADGSLLTMNTDSALDIQFTDSQRLLHLHTGEILVETAPDSSGRPFLIETKAGRIQALGTKFMVRQQDENKSKVSVLESAVSIQPGKLTTPLVLEQGRQVVFDTDHIGTPSPVDDLAASWIRGVLIAVDWRLDNLLAELSRYRHGWLGCDPAVAGFRVSGAFQLSDTDAALAALEKSFPVTLTRRTRYWVRVDVRKG